MPINPSGRSDPGHTSPPSSTTTNTEDMQTTTTVTMGSRAQNYAIATSSGASVGAAVDHALSNMLADVRQSTFVPIVPPVPILPAPDCLNTESISDDQVCRQLYENIMHNRSLTPRENGIGTPSTQFQPGFDESSDLPDFLQSFEVPSTQEDLLLSSGYQVSTNPQHTLPGTQVEITIDLTKEQTWCAVTRARMDGILWLKIAQRCGVETEDILKCFQDCQTKKLHWEQLDEEGWRLYEYIMISEGQTPRPLNQTYERSLYHRVPSTMLNTRYSALTINELGNVVALARKAGLSVKDVASYLEVGIHIIYAWSRKSHEAAVENLRGQARILYNEIIASHSEKPTANVSSPPAAPSVFQTSNANARSPALIQQPADWHDPAAQAAMYRQSIDTIRRIVRISTPRTAPYPPVRNSAHRLHGDSAATSVEIETAVQNVESAATAVSTPAAEAIEQLVQWLKE